MEIKLITKHWPHFKFIILIFSSILFSCIAEKNEAQEIIDKTIAVHGGEIYNNVLIKFDFRGRSYSARKSNRKFTYTREFEDSLGRVKDVLNNDGFTRYINNQPVELPDEWSTKYSNSINGVIYFALLPYPLNDSAVNKEFLGEDSIKGIPYYKIRVTFSKKGGGADYNDNFIYWIHKENFTMDYFAYDYETDGGGSRFREAVNPQYVGGILFQDYNNYEPLEEITLEKYNELYENGKLKEVSVINLENIQVEHF